VAATAAPATRQGGLCLPRVRANAMYVIRNNIRNASTELANGPGKFLGEIEVDSLAANCRSYGPQSSMSPLHGKDGKLAKVKLAQALGTILLLFVGVYGPAFLIVALLKLPPFEAIPVVIVITLAVAILLIRGLSGRTGGFEGFGFQFCRQRYIAAAIVFGTPIGWALTILVRRLSSSPPVPEMSFRPWMMILYFVVGAAIQEEVIFRGLLQTTLAWQFPATFSFFGTSFSYAATIIALLFGLIHTEVNPITAAAAFVLGLLSGELRRRSGSLLPAILVHAVFNAFSAIS
jgi:membrane protease YdiL (CAAX protease family)